MSKKIPKIIHYCWFGGNEKPECILKCIKSWKKYCPDYEIKEWNETNFDINLFQYTKEAYEAKKWAFVSDVARLWVIYNYGGIYMDTDVEILNNIDHILEYDLFMFFQSERTLNTGMGFGAPKNNHIVKSILDDYRKIQFVSNNGKYNMTACPILNTNVLREIVPEIQLNGHRQIINNMAFFSCADYNKLMYHYGAQSWTNEPNFEFKKRQYKDNALKRFLRKPSRIDFIEKHVPKKLCSIYIFISYDLLESGISKYIKKLFKKFSG